MDWLGSSPEATDNLRLKDSVRESAEGVGTAAKEGTGEKQAGAGVSRKGNKKGIKSPVIGGERQGRRWQCGKVIVSVCIKMNLVLVESIALENSPLLREKQYF